MKRSSGPRETAHLSKCLHYQLNTYALAAGAVGVGLLTLAQPAEAKIVYTRIHRVIGGNEFYGIDLNHDGKADFVVVNSTTFCDTDWCTRDLWVEGAPCNGVVGVLEHGIIDAALALERGKRIGTKDRFYGLADMATVNEPPGTYCHSGYWCNLKNRYLGLRFNIHGQTHYGWVRLSVSVTESNVTANLTGYAYETVPNKAIIAGKTQGPDVITLQAKTAGTLGHLALGRR